jgi:hypothetical protein
MADGRMLKKVISTSPRVAALKNDTHRLIYTWLIPFLDVDGRHEADARIIKGHIIPLLDHITTKIIDVALRDMAENDLIMLYSVDGKNCLELRNCKKRQSDIPSPDAGVPTELSSATDGVPTDNRRSTAQQDKIREDKIIYIDCVALTNKEFEKLKTDHGEKIALKAIELLNNYKMQSGKKYKSDYHAILNWAIEKANNQNGAPPGKPKIPDNTPAEIKYVKCPACHADVSEDLLTEFGCLKCEGGKDHSGDVKKITDALSKAFTMPGEKNIDEESRRRELQRQKDKLLQAEGRA